MRALLPHVNIVSIDLKLRSATGTSMPAARHSRFLRLVTRRGLSAYCKAVVCSDTSPAEVVRAARLIRAVRRSVPLILQPVTQTGRAGPRPPAPDALLRLQEAAAEVLDEVRVMPQIHKFIGQR